ncbi:MAG: fasciclin domain-containing protein, partial [Sphingobacteriales bacterium]
FFAPSASALQQLSQKSAEATREILLGHIVEGRFTEADLHDGKTLTTLSKQTLKVIRKKDRLLINGRRIVTSDQPASNGIMHTVSDLLVKDMGHMSML